MAKFPVESGNLYAARLIVLFQQPESLAHYLAGRVVAARVDLCDNKPFELRGKRDVHEGNLLLSMLTRMTIFVNPWHRSGAIQKIRSPNRNVISASGGILGWGARIFWIAPERCQG